MTNGRLSRNRVSRTSSLLFGSASIAVLALVSSIPAHATFLHGDHLLPICIPVAGNPVAKRTGHVHHIVHRGRHRIRHVHAAFAAKADAWDLNLLRLFDQCTCVSAFSAKLPFVSTVHNNDQTPPPPPPPPPPPKKDDNCGKDGPKDGHGPKGGPDHKDGPGHKDGFGSKDGPGPKDGHGPKDGQNSKGGPAV